MTDDTNTTPEDDDNTESIDIQPSVSNTARNTQATPTLSGGTAVGRYVIIDHIGAGGMGVVYRAYDPKLDRRVALKLLLKSAGMDDDDARIRLMREAQALAQLSHPNVVSAFDIGTVDDNVFIAMEFIEGETLGTWLQSETHSQEDILNIFNGAGKGLAAAHKVGLVHRDFKPSNVVIGQDGRPRVLDFGLARATGHDDLSASSDGISSDDWEAMDLEGSTSTRLLESQLTAMGKVVGTLAFMAPERFLGREIDGRADQFSFGVALYTALYRQRPYGGKPQERRQKVLSGEVDPAPENTAVPLWLRKVLLRSMRPDPDDRYENMEALLDALGDDPKVKLLQRLRATGLALLVLTLITALVVVLVQQRVDCAPPKNHLNGIWSPQVQDAIEQQFAAHGAIDTFKLFRHHIDAFVQEWENTYTHSCEDTHTLKRYPQQVLNQRMACLEQRKNALGSLTRALQDRAEKNVLEKAVRAALTLPLINDCNNISALGSSPPLPKDTAQQQRVKVLREELQRITTERNLGRAEQALLSAKKLVQQTETLGYTPVHAEALYRLADLYGQTADYAAEETYFRKAALMAARAKNRKLYVECWTELLFTVGYWLSRTEDVPEIVEVGEAALAFLGEAPAVEARFLSKLGVIRWQEGLRKEARRHLARAIQLGEASMGHHHPDVAAMHNNMGLVLVAMRNARAASVIQVSRKIYPQWQAFTESKATTKKPTGYIAAHSTFLPKPSGLRALLSGQPRAVALKILGY